MMANNNETKRGRGRPPGSLKPCGLHATLKIRLTTEDLAAAHVAAGLAGKDISAYVRGKIKERKP